MLAAIFSGCVSKSPQQQTPSPAETQPSSAPSPKNAQSPPLIPLPQVREISVESGNLYFKPNTLALKLNEPVKINISNKGGHTFTIADLGVSVNLTGPSATVTFTPKKTGAFALTCDIPGHKQAGMEGTVTVE